jgi:hypothetical protein
MELSKIIKIRNLGLFLMAAGVILSLTTQWLPSNHSPFVPITSLITIVGFVTLIFVGITPCPYCKKHFFWSWHLSNIFTNKCVHCNKGVNDGAL